jgi:HD-GYP domain-containing protein (c-di-GMP phosphodiesterase class II)
MALRPVILPPELIGQRAPCDLFNARGLLLAVAGSVIALRERNALRPTCVYCAPADAARISDVNPIAELARINRRLAAIVERVERGEAVSRGELVALARDLHQMWTIDADACLGYARLCKSANPSIDHVVHVALIVAELADAQRLDSDRTICVIGGALTMNAATFRLHDEFHARAEPPNEDQLSGLHAHPQESVRLLGCIGNFAKPWLDAVGDHHENIDGSGYPRALKGGEIPLAARMVRVSDVFAARLTARRTRPPKHWNLRRTEGTSNRVQHVFGSDQENLDAPLMTQLVGALGRFPPGSLVRLSTGELAVSARRVPGQTSEPREVQAIRDGHGQVLHAPRTRPLHYRECKIRHYADDEALRLPTYDWAQVWGYSA